MSNNAVGPVYAKIIQDVLEASQVDFEEGGVDQSTLDRLREIWQDKLSSIRVAQFPWDPTPAQPTPPTSQAPPTKQQPSSGNATPAQTPPVSTSMQPPVKTEQSRPMPQPNGAYSQPQLQQPTMANMTAQQRAAAALQQKFGQQAAPQISQLQGQTGFPQRAPMPQGVPYQSGQQDVKPSPAALQQMQQAQQRSSLPNSQTDGTDDALADWKAEVARRRAEAAADPGRGDRLFREHFLALQQRKEGGGLMMPLDERYHPRTSVKRKIANALPTDPVPELIPLGADPLAGEVPQRLQQFDGIDDDDDVKDEDDEDAINSDLDDPDDLAGDPDADAETDQAMLCTYDKVQRVKNKWKCTLKDGVLKVDGKEYVFHKGQGEFEW